MDREALIDSCHPAAAHQLRQSQSPSLASYDSTIGRRPVRVTFIFGDVGFEEVMIEPCQAAKGYVMEPMSRLLGRPQQGYAEPGMIAPERRTVWLRDGYEVHASQTEMGMFTISFRTRKGR